MSQLERFVLGLEPTVEEDEALRQGMKAERLQTPTAPDESLRRKKPLLLGGDQGLAELYCRHAQGRVCRDPIEKRTYYFESPIWKRDDRDLAYDLFDSLRKDCAAVVQYMQSMEYDDASITPLKSVQKSLQRLSTMKTVFDLACKGADGLAMNGEWNSSPSLVAFPNGVYDFAKDEFRDGRPDDYLRQCAGVEYDPKAGEPVVFLEAMRTTFSNLIQPPGEIETPKPRRRTRQRFLDLPCTFQTI